MSPSSKGKKKGGQARKREKGTPTQGSVGNPVPDSLDMLAEFNTWSGLEQLKLRTASAMDRVEFLASTSNRLVDFKETESRTVDSMLRTQIQPGGRQQLALSGSMGKSRSAAALVFESQTDRLLKDRTFLKRQNALTKFVVEQELQKSGEAASKAAKASGKAARSHSAPRPYPSYNELYNRSIKLASEARESPFLAVNVLKPYKVPEEALPTSLASSTATSPTVSLTRHQPAKASAVPAEAVAT